MVNIFDKSYAGSQALFNPAQSSERLINLVDDSGKSIGSVPESQLPQAIKQGYHIESPEQKQINDYAEENSGTSGALKTAALYAGNELGFGAPKELIKAFQSPQEAALTEAKYKALGQANPGSAGIGTAAGFAGSLALGSPLFKGAAEAGRGVEGLITAGKTAEELGLGTKLLSKAAGGAIENALVGSALSAPKAIDQLRQGNPKEAAEAVLINAGIGALFGGIHGVASEGAKAGINKIFGGQEGLQELSDSKILKSFIPQNNKASNEILQSLEEKGISKSDIVNYIKDNNLFRTPLGSFDSDILPKLESKEQSLKGEFGNLNNVFDQEKWKTISKEDDLIKSLKDLAEISIKHEENNKQFAMNDALRYGYLAMHPAHVPLAAGGALASKAVKNKYNEWLGKAIDFTNNSIINAANESIDKKLSIIPKIINTSFSAPGAQAASNSLYRTLSDNGFDIHDKHENKDIAAFNTFSSLLSDQVNRPDNHIAQITQAVNKTDPSTANQLQNASGNVINYLYKQMPKSNTPPIPFQKPWEPTAQQLKQFNSTVQVAGNPFVVLDKLADGSLNQNHVQALKALYPSVYSKLVEQVRQEGLKNNAATKIPYRKKLQLSLLLEQPLDPSLNNIQALQDSYAQNKPQGKPLAKGKLEDLPGSQKTELQRVQAGESA